MIFLEYTTKKCVNTYSSNTDIDLNENFIEKYIKII